MFDAMNIISMLVLFCFIPVTISNIYKEYKQHKYWPVIVQIALLALLWCLCVVGIIYSVKDMFWH